MKYVRLVLAGSALALGSVSMASAATKLDHVTLYSSKIAEVYETRSFDLQPGKNIIEWRGILPQANLHNIRIDAQDVVITQQEVTYDGPLAKGSPTAILRLTVQNSGGAGKKTIGLDYLTPSFTWNGEYALSLDSVPGKSQNRSQLTGMVDHWVSLTNLSESDVETDAIYLVGGNVKLFPSSDGGYAMKAKVQQNYMMQSMAPAYSAREPMESDYMMVSELGAFQRFKASDAMFLKSNVAMVKVPVFQKVKLALEQRFIFENSARDETKGGDRFTLLPRPLDIRLVAKNTAPTPMLDGQLTVYQKDGALAQVVGQAVIPYTPQNGQITIPLGTSPTLMGTRQILAEESFEIQDSGIAKQRIYRKQMTVELVITNHGHEPENVILREGIEPYGKNQWKIVNNSMQFTKTAANQIEFQFSVPANGEVKVQYMVECQ